MPLWPNYFVCVSLISFICACFIPIWIWLNEFDFFCYLVFVTHHCLGMYFFKLIVMVRNASIRFADWIAFILSDFEKVDPKKSYENTTFLILIIWHYIFETKIIGWLSLTFKNVTEITFTQWDNFFDLSYLIIGIWRYVYIISMKYFKKASLG